MNNHIKEILLIVGFFISVGGVLPYIFDVFYHRTKPHIFSWLIWSLLTAIAFFGQLHDNGGAGAWMTAINCGTCVSVLLLSLNRGEKNITRSDIVSFMLALSAIPLWILTHTPLYSMILVTLIDMLGFYPTFRKAWDKPHEETLKTFVTSGVSYAIAFAALENYTIVTVIYPLSLVVTNIGFALYAFTRRKILEKIQ